MNTAFAAGTSSLIKTDSSLSAYFMSQFDNLTPWKIILGLVMGCVVGLIIAFVYKRCYRGVLYSPTFAMTLMMLTLITTPVVMCIKSDIALSMGMVGALSIVRFRTAVKDPMDTAYMFWALTMGILLGAGQFLLAALSVVGIAAVIFMLRTMLKKGEDSYLLVMRVNKAGEANAQKLMTKLRYQSLKNKTISNNGIELTYEVRVEKSEAFLNKLLTLEGVKEASLVSYSNETA
jgi:uncharacterized membrane protein YhiD involved in acid resistance